MKNFQWKGFVKSSDTPKIIEHVVIPVIPTPQDWKCCEECDSKLFHYHERHTA